MRIPKPIVTKVFLLSICAGCLLGEPLFQESSKSQPVLDEILKKCAEYCEKVEHSALFFVCQEKIKEILYPGAGVTVYRTKGGTGASIWEQTREAVEKMNVFVYDYQLMKKGEEIKESRTLVEENGQKRNEKNAPLKTRRFYSLKSVFGPVGLVGTNYQPLYEYSFIKEDKFAGRKAYVIEAIPKMKTQEVPNYGKLWVDQEDSSILKIEMAQESLAGFDDFQKESKKKRLVPKFTTTHYYGLEKNGIRFPSKTTFVEDYLRGRARFRCSETEIKYAKYKFFTVEVEVKY